MLGSLLENLLSAGRDIDFGTVVGEGLGNHKANAGFSPGYDTNPALDIEQILDSELGVFGCHDACGVSERVKIQVWSEMMRCECSKFASKWDESSRDGVGSEERLIH